MKTFNLKSHASRKTLSLLRIAASLAALVILFVFSSCEKNITVESVVHNDGSIDRTIIFMDADSGKMTDNFFGIGAPNGWATTAKPAKSRETGDVGKKYNVSFRKSFASTEALNQEMNTPNDTLFNIRSDFRKNFRWFYTYIKYSDTYRSINRFQPLPLENYFTEEDFSFINRLPAEGKPIAKADSLYLVKLNEKIFDHYAMRMIYEEHVDIFLKAASTNQPDKPWRAMVENNKEKMYLLLMKLKDNAPDHFMIPLLDSVGVNVTDMKIENDYQRGLKELDRRLSFMTTANETKFIHAIKMPWKVIASNADSVSGSSLYWRPPVARFILNDYTMYAEARHLNYWTLLVSLGVIALTAFVFLKKRS